MAASARILIADNDALIRTLLAEALQERGYQVRAAADGIAAWEQIQADPPDYLILDLIMPELDGMRLCRYVKADPRFAAVRIIVLSGSAVEAASWMAELGADGCLAKRAAPAMVQELTALLAALQASTGVPLEGVIRSLETARPRQIVLELLAERAHLGAILQNLGEGVLVLDGEGRVLLMNAAAERLIERREAALLGSPLTDVLGALSGAAVRRAIRDLLSPETGGAVRLQFPYRDRMLYLTLTGLPQGDRMRNFLLLIRDVTSFTRRIDELTALNNLASIFTSTLGISELLRRATTCILALLEAEAGSVLLVDPVSDELRFEVALGPCQDRLVGLRLAPGQGVAGWVAREGAPVLVPEAGGDPRFSAAIDALSGFTTRSILCVPLRIRSSVIGVLQVLNEVGRRPFDAEDLSLLAAVASQVAAAVENTRLHEAARERARQLETLNAVTRTLTTALSPEKVRQEIVGAVPLLFPGVAVRLWHRAVGDRLQLSASAGLRRPDETGGLHLRIGEGLIGLAAATRRVMTSADIRCDPRFLYRDWATREGL
ncbi:MAG: GAF domain-containing protein, partial [Candidatus Methylomirabilota bacterium]